MKTSFLAIVGTIVFCFFNNSAYATTQLLSEYSDEPNIFGYFVSAMSVFIIGTSVTLYIKKWKKK